MFDELLFSCTLSPLWSFKNSLIDVPVDDSARLEGGTSSQLYLPGLSIAGEQNPLVAKVDIEQVT